MESALMQMTMDEAVEEIIDIVMRESERYAKELKAYKHLTPEEAAAVKKSCGVDQANIDGNVK